MLHEKQKHILLPGMLLASLHAPAGKIGAGKVEKRLLASPRLGQRLRLQSIVFGNFCWIKSWTAELNGGGGSSPLHCSNITTSTGHSLNLHLREFYNSHCGMKKPNKSVNSH